MTVIKNKSTPEGKEFWDHVEAIAMKERVAKNVDWLASPSSPSEAGTVGEPTCRTVLVALVGAVDAVEAHPDYRSVFTSAFIHGTKYGGPNWENQLKAAKAYLAGSALKPSQLSATEARLRTALLSIASNTCCGGCQEAALVAKAALAGVAPSAPDGGSSPWISVDSELPPELTVVLVRTTRLNTYTARRVEDGWEHWASGMDDLCEEVTHWQHLPEPPAPPLVSHESKDALHKQGGGKESFTQRRSGRRRAMMNKIPHIGQCIHGVSFSEDCEYCWQYSYTERIAKTYTTNGSPPPTPRTPDGSEGGEG